MCNGIQIEFGYVRLGTHHISMAGIDHYRVFTEFQRDFSGRVARVAAEGTAPRKISSEERTGRAKNQNQRKTTR